MNDKKDHWLLAEVVTGGNAEGSLLVKKKSSNIYLLISHEVSYVHRNITA
jgi:hypothetical protein